MPSESLSANGQFERVVLALSRLRVFEGPPKEFWPTYVTGLAELSGASKAVILYKEAGPNSEWRKLGDWSAHQGAAAPLAMFTRQMHSLAEEAAARGQLVYPLAEGPARNGIPKAVGLRLRLHKPEDICVAALLLPESSSAEETLHRLQLAADVPSSYQTFQISRQAKADVEKIAAALDIGVQVNQERRFLAAALAFCNGVATRFKCDRVSLGWSEGGYARLRALSRTEKFDRQMAAAQLLEAAMDETLDQDEELIWPAPEGATCVMRDHERFANEQRVGQIISLPLRVADKAIAVLSCERHAPAFLPAEWQQLRLCCDQVTPRLADLHHRDRWFGSRWSASLRPVLAKWVGPDHTWAKIVALAITLLLAVVLLVPVPYRVEGNFLLRAEQLAYLSAPFDGYLSEVLVRPGDPVAAGAPLVRLDTRQLLLEEAMALADHQRFTREAEKARAAKSLAEMRVAEAMAQQAQARLDLTRYHLDQAEIKASFAGVVVEGDLRERLAAPVKQGDALCKIARLDTLYVEAEVNERDVHEIDTNAQGEMAFVSQPKRKYPIRVTRVEAAAFPKNSENLFIVRCALVNPPDLWWRPGMSGLVKIDAGQRTLFYIFTHRTVDFLRMWWWW